MCTKSIYGQYVPLSIRYHKALISLASTELRPLNIHLLLNLNSILVSIQVIHKILRVLLQHHIFQLIFQQNPRHLKGCMLVKAISATIEMYSYFSQSFKVYTYHVIDVTWQFCNAIHSSSATDSFLKRTQSV